MAIFFTLERSVPVPYNDVSAERSVSVPYNDGSAERSVPVPYMMVQRNGLGPFCTFDSNLYQSDSLLFQGNDAF